MVESACSDDAVAFGFVGALLRPQGFLNTRDPGKIPIDNQDPYTSCRSEQPLGKSTPQRNCSC